MCKGDCVSVVVNQRQKDLRRMRILTRLLATIKTISIKKGTLVAFQPVVQVRFASCQVKMGRQGLKNQQMSD